MSVVGARPNIIKMAPIHTKLSEIAKHTIVHTGQHYDYQMSEIFFKEFKLPKPSFNLEIGSGTGCYQIGATMISLEKIILEHVPDLVLVYGDTNSTLAGALTARKCNTPLAHIESGLRSFDMRMPEETNRILADHISNILFAPTPTAVTNLKKENVRGNILYTGDLSVEIVQEALRAKSLILHDLKLESRSYILLTMHRAENTEHPSTLSSIAKVIEMLDPMTVVFPIHPRTKKIMQNSGLYNDLEKRRNLKLIPPVGYVDFINLVKNAKKVVTDSGGVQKEAYLLETPCITLRQNTEWIETLSENRNILVGTETDAIVRAIRDWVPNDKEIKPVFGSGGASNVILNEIKENLR
ncbi:MAG: UDP-N-acetylglucosamine 2-epimerase (non-hydrolyzing) [Nitrososphaerota archaeon]